MCARVRVCRNWRGMTLRTKSGNVPRERGWPLLPKAGLKGRIAVKVYQAMVC